MPFSSDGLRCGARTRFGQLCASFPVRGKRRCRMHGGAHGSGAPRGNKNALTHGRTTARAINTRKSLRKLMGEAKAYLKDFK